MKTSNIMHSHIANNLLSLSRAAYPVEFEITTIYIHWFTYIMWSTNFNLARSLNSISDKTNLSGQINQEASRLPICYHPYSTTTNDIACHSWHFRCRGKKYCRSDSKAVKMAIIHCKFQPGPQWLLPTILMSLNMDSKCSQTLIEPFFCK